MGIRRSFVVVAIIAIVVGASGVAFACSEPGLYVFLKGSPPGARSKNVGSGNTVEFQIPGLEPGARFALSVEGRQVAKGVDDDTDPNGYTGTFEMPDLGSKARTVHVVAVLQHDDINQPIQRIDYLNFTGTGPAEAGEPAPPEKQEKRERSRKQRTSEPSGSSDGSADAAAKQTPIRSAPHPAPAPGQAEASRVEARAHQAKQVRAESQGANAVERPVLRGNLLEPGGIGHEALGVEVTQPAPRMRSGGGDPWWLVALAGAAMAVLFHRRKRRVPEPPTVVSLATTHPASDEDRPAA